MIFNVIPLAVASLTPQGQYPLSLKAQNRQICSVALSGSPVRVSVLSYTVGQASLGLWTWRCPRAKNWTGTTISTIFYWPGFKGHSQALAYAAVTTVAPGICEFFLPVSENIISLAPSNNKNGPVPSRP